MLLFAAHDPGAKNHIRPIYERALTLGEAPEFIDLSSSNEFMDYDAACSLVPTLRPELLIAGCSANQAEWALVCACKHMGVDSIVMVDLAVAGKLDTVRLEDFPRCFMVTNTHCKEEVIARGALPESVVVTGSAHLERLSKRELGKDELEIKQWYGIDNSSDIVPFFCAPDLDSSIEALVSLMSFISSTQLSQPITVVRPHPRTARLESLKYACRQFQNVRYDSGDFIGRVDLLRASKLSLAMASTVSLESLVLGIPSAFYQIGWDFHQVDGLYRSLDMVPRLREPDQLSEFVRFVLDQEYDSIPDGIEYYEGAAERIWQIVSELRERSNK